MVTANIAARNVAARNAASAKTPTHSTQSSITHSYSSPRLREKAAREASLQKTPGSVRFSMAAASVAGTTSTSTTAAGSRSKTHLQGMDANAAYNQKQGGVGASTAASISSLSQSLRPSLLRKIPRSASLSLRASVLLLPRQNAPSYLPLTQRLRLRSAPKSLSTRKCVK